MALFNWQIFIFLVLICIPGLIAAIPGLFSSVEETIKAKAEPGKKLPSMKVLKTIFLGQNLILIAIITALGTLLAPKVGLMDPFLKLLVEGKGSWIALIQQLIPAINISLLGVGIFLLAYYFIFRPRLDKVTLKVAEGLRMKLGLSGRILYGGIIEEVLTRWGLMTIFAWLGLKIFGTVTSGVMWGAILLAGVLFALGHLPAYITAGCRKTAAFYSATLFLNLWAAIIFGWLFWQYGLIAAITAHMLFHFVWYPFDLYFVKKEV